MRRTLALLALLALLGGGCEGAAGGDGDGDGGPSDATGSLDADAGPGAGDALHITAFDVRRGDSQGADAPAGPDVPATEDATGPDVHAGDAGGDAPRDGGADGDAWEGPTLTLEPGTLSFFSLPVGSLRYAVSGWDAVAATCVSLIWDFSNTGHAPGAWCDGFGPQFPYVLVRPDARGRCGDWDYGSDLVTEAASGCVDFEGAAPASMDLVDVAVHVSGAAYTGRILVSNRERRFPQPVSIGLRVAPSAGPVVVQAADDRGLPGWLTLETGGAAFLPFDRCDRKACADTVEPTCPPGPTARTLDPATGAASIWVSWDGRLRVDDEEEACRQRIFAEGGAYRATFCYGRQADAAGRVIDPICRTVDFRYPATRVDWTIE